MPEWPTNASRWIRRLLTRGGQDDATADHTERVITSGALAVLATESLACQALCLQAKRGNWRRDSAAPGELHHDAFGHRVAEVHQQSARAVLAAAAGLTMTGSRAAAFMTSDRLAEVHDQLYAAAGRRLPLVIHAAARAVPRQSRAFGSGHEGYHAVAATGAVLMCARNAQHAVDLTLAARRVAETSLTPVIVAMDGPETAGAAQDLVLPTAELVRLYLGAPDVEVLSPSDAQRIVFGQHRRRLPRWFDLDRPVAFGTAQAGDDYGLAAAGRRLFFDDAVSGMLDLALAALAGNTGRPLATFHTHRLAKAKHVVVAQGSVVELAEAVADHLASGRRAKVGVLSVDVLRPFPAKRIAEALAGAEVVTVLERADDPLGQAPPLLADVALALRGRGPELRSAVYGMGGRPVSAADLVAVFDAMGDPEGGGRRIVGASLGERSRFPKRQVLLDAVTRAYPELSGQLLPAGDAVDVRPAGARSVSVHALPSTVPEEGLTTLATALASVVGPHVRSGSRMIAHRTWTGLVTACAEPLRAPGDEVPVDVAWVSSLDLPSYVSPVASVVACGALVVSVGLDADAIWARLPAAWRRVIRERDLSVYATEDALEDAADAVAALLAEREHGLQAVAIPSVEVAGDDDDVITELPDLVQRIARNDTAYDNPSRFWGEVIQPRMLGEAPQRAPDPYLALGAVPASTATFRDSTLARTQLPVVDAARCTGCGKCWTACPDSALGPVAVSPRALLDAAATLAGVEGAVAAKLRRSHGHLAGQLAKALRSGGAQVVEEAALRAAYSWLAGKGTFKDEERAEADAAFEATLAALDGARVAVTATFFGDAEAATAGSGELFTLAVNPRACQACTSCVMACPEDAIAMQAQTPAVLADAAAGWRVFEGLPDTPGATIDRVRDELGLAAVHLSRRCHLAVAGGVASEPGLGARLAARLVAGAIEHRAMRRASALEERLAGLGVRLRRHIRDALADAFHPDDLQTLGAALGDTGARRPALGDVVAQLAARGEGAHLDAAALRRVAADATALDTAREQLEKGPNGVGRAHLGLVVSSGEVADWAARFPHHAFYAPLAVDLGGDGPELAAGIQRGLLDRYVELFRLARQAELRLAGKPDLGEQLRALDDLRWQDLTADERAEVPPLVLLADAESLGTQGLSGLSQVLSGDLPIRVVLLDRREGLGQRVDPTLFGLAHRNAFVVAGSIAYPEHLFDGVSAALNFEGPALIHVIAPSPARDGFGTGLARERARQAVVARVHPLVTYDPGKEGVFGARIDLSANPEPQALWVTTDEGAELTPADWAAGHARGADAGEAEVADRRANWTTLQELAGLVTPFTRQVRDEAERDVTAATHKQLETVKRDYEARLGAARSTTRQAQVAQLQRRLMQLAGFPPPGEG